MKVILLQLPVQGHDFFFSGENIPLAAAYLKEIGEAQGADVELAPRRLMSFGGDRAILQHLRDAQPAILGMTCYAWNLERSLFLAQQLKQEFPACRIVLGGPEITPDNDFLLRHPAFDVGVVGEGEQPWEDLLKAFPQIPETPGLLLREGGGWRYCKGHASLSRLGRRPSPYLSGSLDSHLNEVLWIETMRGCRHRCAYCYYHKAFSGIRTFPVERIRAEVERARSWAIREIVLLDPCFSKRPNLGGLLAALAEVNRDRQVRFSAECNAEDIDPATAKRLAEAGFQQMEVGLQSTRPETLKGVHRRFNPKRFLQGVKYLQDHGIEVMVDLIAGLPGDRLQDICRSLDWIVEKEAYDFLMLYPLSVLPATELRQRAGDLGISAMPHPPYLITGGRGLSAPEIARAFHHYETCMGEDISPLEMPPALDPWDPRRAANLGRELCLSIDWKRPEEIRSLPQREASSAYALTIKMTRKILTGPRRWVSILKEYMDRNPFSLFSVEVEPEVFPEELEPLWRLAGGHHHPLERDYTVTHSPYRSFLVFSRARGLLWKWPDPREWEPLLLPDGQQVPCGPVCVVAGAEVGPPEWFLDYLKKRYSPLPEIRLWQPIDDEE